MDKLALFRLVFVASRWIRARLTPVGMVVAAMTGFAGALGLDTQQNLAHMVFALGASLVAVDAIAAVLARRNAPALTAQRYLPDFVTAGEPARYRLTLRNTGRKAMPPLLLVECLRQPWPLPGALRWNRIQSTNLFDRLVGYPDFLDLLRRLRALEIAPMQIPPLVAGQLGDINVPVAPTARGLAVFESLRCVMTGPLGLIAVRVPVDVDEACLVVLPRRQPVLVPPASNHRQLQPGGIALALHVGDAEEFRSLRDYRPGDSLRSIHWRSFARTGRPVVREYQEEYFSRHALVLDTAAQDPYSSTFEAAVSMAAWLVVQPRDSDSLLDLMFVGNRVHRLTVGRGLGGAVSLLRVLATVSPTAPGNIDRLLINLDQNAVQVSSLIAIFLAWDEARQSAVRRLLARGVQVTVLVVEEQAAKTADDGAEFAGILRRIDASKTSPAQVRG